MKKQNQKLASYKVNVTKRPLNQVYFTAVTNIVFQYDLNHKLKFVIYKSVVNLISTLPKNQADGDK